MCTVVIFRRPGHAWPLIFASNRDEMRDRQWRPPARHWRDRPYVTGGLDLLAGGTWLGLNDDGVLAAVLNRPGTLGPLPGLRSRGELVLEALDHSDAVAAVDALSGLNAKAYRAFNMVIADNRDAFWIKSFGEADTARVAIAEVPEGLSMITGRDRNDIESARIRFHLPRFAGARVPEPDGDDWTDWESLLSSRDAEPDAGPHGAMSIVTDTGFGTMSSSLIALPSVERSADAKPIWRFSAAPPDSSNFYRITL